jgi:hypothetical protein
VLGTQETFCIVIAGLFERDSFDLLLPEFDKPWVIHLRETCCCSTNLCTWGPNTVYKNRRVRRHHYTELVVFLLRPVCEMYGHGLGLLRDSPKVRWSEDVVAGAAIWRAALPMTLHQTAARLHMYLRPSSAGRRSSGAPTLLLGAPACGGKRVSAWRRTRI